MRWLPKLAPATPSGGRGTVWHTAPRTPSRTTASSSSGIYPSTPIAPAGPLPGSGICETEWYVAVESPELAEPDPDAQNGDAWDNPLHPACYRDASELRTTTHKDWHNAREALSHD